MTVVPVDAHFLEDVTVVWLEFTEQICFKFSFKLFYIIVALSSFGNAFHNAWLITLKEHLGNVCF